MSEHSKTMALWLLGSFSKPNNKEIVFRLFYSVFTFRLESGLIGALQTDEKYYGHGYGALVTKCLSKNIAEMGSDVYAEIAEDNKASRSLFNKHGFEPVGKVHWILTKGTWSPDN